MDRGHSGRAHVARILVKAWILLEVQEQKLQNKHLAKQDSGNELKKLVSGSRLIPWAVSETWWLLFDAVAQ